ncbi:Alpha/Beta hydrolase protein [Pseudomassariella vexata]|uniref:Alpha/Beta hydrolase protein n=1 Tax=Pseudomassariella vexata TaxID=1141098 RepID=A0A1Y2EGK4_9PEZI|nr:Alpha/Beta hydrolase protein [Pseudomassariella vexata]ORY70386.1 Alpha/Beta hydrolase protein [Pseudomassariella vexata]
MHYKYGGFVAISDAELELLRKKLKLTRLPTGIADSQWGESNGVTFRLIQETVKFWMDEYDWRQEEAKINQMPQFKTAIEMDDFGSFDIHFVHFNSNMPDTIPLLFLHGWSGSFIEVQKVLKTWNEAGFDVVAPSLPGYGFFSYTEREGLKLFHHADIMNKLMLRIGYNEYVVQGGDWGSMVGRSIALRHPDNAKLLHLNMLDLEPKYTPFELRALEFVNSLLQTEFAYFQVHQSKPRTLGYAMHDSPAGMLAWMADKLFLITWTLLHYFPGPTTGFQMYRENFTPVSDFMRDALGGSFLKSPVGMSAFPKEIRMVPRAWAETANNIKFWREHEKGGHFAAYEKPDELAGDVIEFFKVNWNA